MRISKLSKNKSGFTLIEVMVAALILIATATAFLDALIQNSTIISASIPYDVALNACQEKLEELTSSDLSKIMSHDNEAFDVIIRYLDSDNSYKEFIIGQGLVDVALVMENEYCKIYNITTTVTWQQQGRELSTSLSASIVYKP